MKTSMSILNELNNSEDLSIYASINEFPEIISKGKDNEERKNLFYRCYVANPKSEEMNRWTIEDLIEYIYETDEYWTEDLDIIVKCAELCGASQEFIDKIKSYK